MNFLACNYGVYFTHPALLYFSSNISHQPQVLNLHEDLIRHENQILVTEEYTLKKVLLLEHLEFELSSVKEAGQGKGSTSCSKEHFRTECNGFLLMIGDCDNIPNLLHQDMT